MVLSYKIGEKFFGNVKKLQFSTKLLLKYIIPYAFSQGKIFLKLVRHFRLSLSRKIFIMLQVRLSII